jgi:hypothetical protein
VHFFVSYGFVKRVFLIHGNPGSGKSTLAKKLRDEHSFEMLSLDELYVEFIKSECPVLYLDAIDKFIAQHYECILHPEAYTKHHFKRDFVNEWHEYLLTTTSEWSARHDDLVVEGFLLYDCLGDLEARMLQAVRVFLVHASDLTYGGPRRAADGRGDCGTWPARRTHCVKTGWREERLTLRCGGQWLCRWSTGRLNTKASGSAGLLDSTRYWR